MSLSCGRGRGGGNRGTRGRANSSKFCFICSEPTLNTIFENTSTKRKRTIGTLCQLLNLPLRDNTLNFGTKFQQTRFCSTCVTRLKEFDRILAGLRRLTNAVREGRRQIENQLKTSFERQQLNHVNHHDDVRDKNEEILIGIFREEIIRELSKDNPGSIFNLSPNGFSSDFKLFSEYPPGGGPNSSKMEVDDTPSDEPSSDEEDELDEEEDYDVKPKFPTPPISENNDKSPNFTTMNGGSSGSGSRSMSKTPERNMDSQQCRPLNAQVDIESESDLDEPQVYVDGEQTDDEVYISDTTIEKDDVPAGKTIVVHDEISCHFAPECPVKFSKDDRLKFLDHIRLGHKTKVRKIVCNGSGTTRRNKNKPVKTVPTIGNGHGGTIPTTLIGGTESEPEPSTPASSSEEITADLCDFMAELIERAILLAGAEAETTTSTSENNEIPISDTAMEIDEPESESTFAIASKAIGVGAGPAKAATATFCSAETNETMAMTVAVVRPSTSASANNVDEVKLFKREASSIVANPDEFVDEDEMKSESDLKCEKCDISFNNNSTLERHLRKDHSLDMNWRTDLKTSPRKRNLRCYICNATFKLPQGLDAHKRTHTRESTGKTSVTSLGELVPVGQGVVPSSSSPPVPVQVSLSSPLPVVQSQSQHVLAISQTAAFPFSCEICGVKYLFKGDLIRHTMTAHENLSDFGTDRSHVDSKSNVTYAFIW